MENVCVYICDTVVVVELYELTEEVHHHYVQDYVGQNEVGKSALWCDAEKLRLVLRIGLETQAD